MPLAYFDKCSCRFSLNIKTLVHFNRFTIQNIQCNRERSFSNALFQLSYLCYICFIKDVLRNHQRKKCMRGARGHGIEFLRPIQRPTKMVIERLSYTTKPNEGNPSPDALSFEFPFLLFYILNDISHRLRRSVPIPLRLQTVTF